MESQISPHSVSINSESQIEFSPGMSVIYGLHGKCQLISIENRQIGGEEMAFYKLEITRPALSRSTRKEPAIWIPVNSAKDRGLRRASTATDVEQILEIFSSREYYFSLNETWSEVHPKLEAAIRTEGAFGLARVCSYLYVLKRKLAVPPTEATKFQEMVNKLLLRELSDATGQSMRELEDQISKRLRQKLIPDN